MSLGTSATLETDLVQIRWTIAMQISEDRRFQALDLPSHVKKDCLRVTAATGNLFSGIDFKVDEQGNYWMLEVNPMPGYDGYDRRLGGCISQSLVHLLTQ